MEKVQLSICVGSSCHLKNSKGVIDKVREEITKRNLSERVLLKASFCFGKCGNNGVSVKVNDDIVIGLTEENVSSFFDEQIVPKLN